MISAKITRPAAAPRTYTPHLPAPRTTLKSVKTLRCILIEDILLRYRSAGIALPQRRNDFSAGDETGHRAGYEDKVGNSNSVR